MPNPIPTPVAADSTGLPDSTWITDVRAALRDYPTRTTETWTADGTNGAAAVNSNPLKVARPPLNGSATANTPLVTDSTIAVNYTIIDTGTPTGTQVLVNYDTGELTFATSPTAGHVIQIAYQTCRWRDQDILTGLYGGLRAMFPRVGKTYTDTSIPIQVNQWDYALPSQFQDPRTQILTLEIADPFIPTEPFKMARPGWKRVGLTTLHIPWSQAYSPVARLRIVSWGPYLYLGDLEPQLYHLPVWYALGTLLPKQEAKRIREDTMVPLTQAGGQAPGIQLQTGDYYARRFEQELDRLARVMGPGPMRPVGTVYQLRQY